MEAEPNFLVIDWDFFFPNPAMMSAPPPESLMYLWDHKEAPFYLGPEVWGNRAADFFRSGNEIPHVEGWQNFWNRFNFNPDGVTVIYGDSNSHAGNLLPSSLGLDQGSNRWGIVSLWDAHHDCGYTATGSLEAWRERGEVSCEDWMLVHHDRGSRLEVIHPAWRKAVGHVEPEPLIPVERRVDDGSDPDAEYDVVYVCRSGAWVPPWCDGEFSRFLEDGPDLSPVLVEPTTWVHPRPDGLDIARRSVELGELRDRMLEFTGGQTDVESIQRWLASKEGQRRG